ncbi:MAG TPA: sulfotransferase domain-containing protein [Tepidisphaeraceae bacterium]|jgi:hypothetical protein|nr:sulfotransferase domain-containing protein [Tepidisphaeraceae bacterium]
MIIWLASYPRSGNTLLRIMLNRVWEMKSYSMYGDHSDISDRQTTARIAAQVGHQSFGTNWDDAYPKLLEGGRVNLVKTHEIPIDNQKAIYVVRDGRSATRSYCQYRMDFNGCTDPAATLRDVILGFTPFGSWSNHLDAWNPLQRPGTLVVKYEDLVQSPDQQIARISEFLQLAPSRPWRNEFEELSRLDSRHFRAAGANRPADALNDGDLRLFTMLHGPWMRRLGYELPSGAGDAPEIDETFRKVLYGAVADQIYRTARMQADADQLAAELNRRIETAVQTLMPGAAGG